MTDLQRQREAFETACRELFGPHNFIHSIFVGSGGPFPKGVTVLMDDQAYDYIVARAPNSERKQNEFWKRTDEYSTQNQEHWKYLLANLQNHYRTHDDFLNAVWDVGFELKDEGIFAVPQFPITEEVTCAAA